MKTQYEELIKKVFPDALITWVENFDDNSDGWVINYQAYSFIEFKVIWGNELNINICRYSVNMYESNIYKYKIFHGDIPGNSNMNPDYEFIEKLLQNCSQIG